MAAVILGGIVTSGIGLGQQPPPSAPTIPPAAATLKAEGKTESGSLFREYVREQKMRFDYGRALKITLPPTGSLTIAGSKRSELTIKATIRVEGASADDLSALAERIGFQLDTRDVRLHLMSVGPSVKNLSRKERRAVTDGLASPLLRLPYRIDYTLTVPEYTDLDVSVFDGDLVLAGMYGGIVFGVQRGQVTLSGVAGTVVGRLATGNARVELSGRSWRGSGLDLRVGVGDILLSVPRGFAADVILTASAPLDIRYPLNREPDLPPDTPFGMQTRGRFGVGGAELQLITARGVIRVEPYPPDEP
ncbi:MAG: hypothetical protein SNJ67_12990 [Chloracidobacterium sp.]|uniref:Adhesin domain-containing protein n=1 Tax=Chloracidobacterium validum TaxID=2821543 RepID=A0ABX8BAT8_9BACT|nr:hypothetical protein [Chloracidobacterium validum]QUW02660.1 hypothetical protein J8C06_09975 [Chloracidobacterium validum]